VFRRGTGLRKVVGTAAAFTVWSAPEAAFMLFLLWVWWDTLWPIALEWWDGKRLKATKLALKNNLSANVNPMHVCMMTTKDRAERERKARFRQRWRSRFGSVNRMFLTLMVTIDNASKELGEWLTDKISIVRSPGLEIDE
jgi:hypothetical protein